MAETKLTTMTDLGDIKSIDFVNKFSKTQRLFVRLLGVTCRQERLTTKIQIHKWTADADTTKTAEGDQFRCSKNDTREATANTR